MHMDKQTAMEKRRGKKDKKLRVKINFKKLRSSIKYGLTDKMRRRLVVYVESLVSAYDKDKHIFSLAQYVESRMTILDRILLSDQTERCECLRQHYENYPCCCTIHCFYMNKCVCMRKYKVYTPIKTLHTPIIPLHTPIITSHTPIITSYKPMMTSYHMDINNSTYSVCFTCINCNKPNITIDDCIENNIPQLCKSCMWSEEMDPIKLTECVDSMMEFDHKYHKIDMAIKFYKDRESDYYRNNKNNYKITIRGKSGKSGKRGKSGKNIMIIQF
jgi:hypothetical protein